MPIAIRRTLSGLQPYSSVDPGTAVDLSDNTNLWGPPPASVAAIHALTQNAMSRYPTTPPTTVNFAVASYAGVSIEHIVAGCGSDDLLDCCMRTFAEPGDTIAFAVPTFSMIPVFARINGLRTHEVPLREDFDIDVDALLAPSPRIVYLCAPNNPTGTMLPPATLERILREASGVVLLDEAYGEFTSAPGFDLVTKFDNLIVVRTLSKAFGLAGLRIGYAVLAPTLARALETVRGPYKLSAAAAVAAQAALSDGLNWVREHALDVVDARERFGQRLTSLGLSPLPSEANFLCIPCANALTVAAGLLNSGFAVRVLRDLPPITPALVSSGGMALRITVGPWPLMERVIVALESESSQCA